MNSRTDIIVEANEEKKSCDNNEAATIPLVARRLYGVVMDGRSKIEDDEDSVLGRRRLPHTAGRNEDVYDDPVDEDDLLTDVVVPEARRLQRLKEIQQPFTQEGGEPYMSSCYLVAKSFNVPISLVSLVYEEFQWFKARFGLKDVNQTKRCWSFCAHTFIPEKPEVLYVPDPLHDDRFCNNDLVHSMPNIKFYCGVPLVTQDGVRLGAFCIIDNKPRTMCREGFQFLINLAELTVRELLQTDVGQKYKPDTKPSYLGAPTLKSEKKFRRIPPAHKLRRLRELWFEKGLTDGVLLLDTSEPIWNVVWTNSQWDSWTEHARVHGRSYPEIWSILHPVKGETGTQMQSKIMEKLMSNVSRSCDFLARVVGLDGKSSVFVSCDVSISSQPIKDLNCQILMPPDDAPGPAHAEPIIFNGNKLLIVFARLARDCPDSDDLRQTSFRDDNAVPTPLLGVPPTGFSESTKAVAAVASGDDNCSPSSPSCPLSPNPNPVFRRASDKLVQ